MSELDGTFIIREIGEIGGHYVVILEGNIETVRNAGKFFGEPVRLVAASPAPTVSGEADEHDLFNNWWAMDQAAGGFSLAVKNVALAAWNARAALEEPHP
jgi:hypothetical protein